MIIDCISDLHGYYPALEGGDILIVAGDLTARDEEDQYYEFNYWLCQQDYQRKIVISGNHDNLLQVDSFQYLEGYPAFEYLCDSGTEFKGLKIWGSPWTKTFKGMNPNCKAFTVDTEEELDSKFSLIPEDTDILITHGPPYGMKDFTIDKKCVGSKALQMQLRNRLSPKLLVFGHIHEDYGPAMLGLVDGCEIVNCSHVNEKYQPVNKPIRIEYDGKNFKRIGDVCGMLQN